MTLIHILSGIGTVAVLAPLIAWLAARLGDRLPPDEHGDL